MMSVHFDEPRIRIQPLDQILGTKLREFLDDIGADEFSATSLRNVSSKSLNVDKESGIAYFEVCSKIRNVASLSALLWRFRCADGEWRRLGKSSALARGRGKHHASELPL